MKERERNILEAARQVFGDHGFYHTKIQDIADTAGIGKGTVYEYFESKEELFCRMVRYSLSLYTQRAREGLGKGGCLERLRNLIRVNRQVVANSGPLVDMFLSNGSIGEDKLLREQIMELFLDVKLEMISLVAEALAAGQAEGLVRPGIDREFAAELFVHMVMGYCQWAVRTGKEGSEDALLELFLSGIGD